jgi:hypothetical protein
MTKIAKIPMPVDLENLPGQFSNIIAMGHLRGVEKRGCGYRVKKTRIYVKMQLQIHSSSRRVLSSRPYILRIKA